MLIVPVTGLLCALLATSVLADDFENGLRFSIHGDYSNAAISFRKAADQGNAEAQFNLALMYEEGRGVTKDDEQAAMWYSKAAEQDYARAQFNLGKMLSEGKGGHQDNIEAYKWLSLAKDKDVNGAKADLDKLASQMAQLQIVEAQLRKSKWLKSRQSKTQPPKQVSHKSLSA